MDEKKDTRIGLVVTTISDGRFLQAYYEAIERYSSPQNVAVYVIGDVNTPPECEAAVHTARAKGARCHYYSLEEQDRFLNLFPGLAQEIPQRSDNRRNVGYLLAFRDRCDVLISVDDDNIPLADSDFFGIHVRTGNHLTLRRAQGREGWFNLCSLLRVTDFSANEIQIYPRGFPYRKRGTDDSRVLEASESGTVAVNVGLWTGDPDVDAATRMTTGCQAGSRGIDSVLLGPRQFTPISCQNVSLIWHAVPAYYYVRMGHRVGSLAIDRFGDVLSGFFVQLCAEAVGHRISLGPPFVFQDRNRHNLFQDLIHEIPGMLLAEELIELLETPLGRASSYDEAYLELAQRLESWVSDGPDLLLWGDQLVPFIEQTARLMRQWVAACRLLASPDELRCGRD